MPPQTNLTELKDSSTSSKSNYTAPVPSTTVEQVPQVVNNSSTNTTQSVPEYLTSDDLLSGERNLLDIWKKRQRLGFNKFNVKMTYGSALLMFTYVCASSEPITLLADRVRSWADLGISFTTTILGFLIAGFTIFATLNRPDMFVAMGKVEKPGTNLSFLKANFFSFIAVFIDYMIFFGACLAIKILAPQNGPLSTLFHFLPKGIPIAGHWFGFKRLSVNIGIVGMATGFTYTTLLLKSFVWNVYHVLMTGIRWHWENPPDNKAK